MKVVLADIDEVDLTRAEIELKALGGTAFAVRTDVSKRSDLELLARRAVAAFGEVHLLFNNAGLTVGGGSASYSVTKRAVAALSESLYLTLQQRNSLVKGSVLCPGIVRTNIAAAERNRPSELRNDPVTMTPQMQAGRAAFKAGL